MASKGQQKTIVVGAGPVGALAALYAAKRGDEVEVYELRGGMGYHSVITCACWALKDGLKEKH